MLRRWRVVVIDDNPEGTLEAVLLSPLVIEHALPRDASLSEMDLAVQQHQLNHYLPLEPDETYAKVADVDFQIRDFATRRAECAPRYPIVEVERDFYRAWNLVTDLALHPPDIVFLDVMFDPKLTKLEHVEEIIDELQSSDRIAKGGRPATRDVLNRGGLFLFGKLLRSRRHVQQMPMIVLYSASKEVKVDFMPFEYASNGHFEVIEKESLRSSAERRKQVFRRRIREFFEDGTIRPDDVRVAVEQLGTPLAMGGDRQTLEAAFSRQIGSDWVFGTMFAADCVAYLASAPERRHLVVDDLEEFIAPLLGDARSFIDFYTWSPARLFSHNGGTVITYSRRPPWLDQDAGTETSSGRTRVTTQVLTSHGSEISYAMEQAVSRLPTTLRDTLGSALPRHDGDSKTPAARLDHFVGRMSGYDRNWEDLLLRCRMKTPVYVISEYVQSVVRKHDLGNTGYTKVTSEWDSVHKLELLLSPADEPLKEPLCSLLSAVFSGIAAQGSKTVSVNYSVCEAPVALQMTIHDRDSIFPGLNHYDPHGRAGDVSTALVAAAEWFDVEIHSQGIKLRPTRRGVAPPEAVDITAGTQFVIRIPAYRLEG